MSPWMNGDPALLKPRKRHIELTTPYYPFIVVPMIGEDGNAFGVLGRCIAAIYQSVLDGHLSNDEATDLKFGFVNDARSGDYVHLIATVMKYFEVT